MIQQRAVRDRSQAMGFHGWLDRLFGQRLAFSIFFRIWLASAGVVLLASAVAIYQLQKSVRPAAQRVVEDTLVDSSRLMAQLLTAIIESDSNASSIEALKDSAFQQQLTEAFINNNAEARATWFHQKSKSQFHLYITDTHGRVIYDSKGQAVGQDFSRWNDIYLTLRGHYGARSSRLVKEDDQSSVMYVASPIFNRQKELIGVVSIGKPIATLLPYLNASRDELLKIMLYIAGFSLIGSALVAWWLRHSIQTINQYTEQLAIDKPPHFYLAKELNQLTATIAEMKHTIENKAYVNDYVHTLTHELKSPLTAIRASGELLGEDLPPPDRYQFSQTIIEQANKLQTLVEQLLVIAKLEQPTFKLQPDYVALSPLVASIIKGQQALQHQRNLKIWQLAETTAIGYVDEFWLMQALQNGIDNAIKFAQHWVIVSVQQTMDAIQVIIINDSPVLPDYVFDKAFERYFSVVSQYTKQKGTGLGLTLAKQVIEHHHGSINGQITLTQQPFETLWQTHLTGHARTDEFEHWRKQLDGRQSCVSLTIQLPRAPLSG